MTDCYVSDVRRLSQRAANGPSAGGTALMTVINKQLMTFS